MVRGFEVELRDGGLTWTSLFRLRAPIRPASAVTGGSADTEDGEASDETGDAPEDATDNEVDDEG